MDSQNNDSRVVSNSSGSNRFRICDIAHAQDLLRFAHSKNKYKHLCQRIKWSIIMERSMVKSIVFFFFLRLYHGLVQLDSIFTDD